jgi:hypothetical protein
VQLWAQTLERLSGISRVIGRWLVRSVQLSLQTFLEWGGIILQANRTYNNQLRGGEVSFLNRRLHEFYDPIYTLLLINSRTFSEFGPRTFPDEDERRDAAAKVWNQVKTEVIIPNNRVIHDIVEGKSHLMAPNDDITEYMSLLNHIVMYNVFQDTPTEIYKKFQFPDKILRH